MTFSISMINYTIASNLSTLLLIILKYVPKPAYGSSGSQGAWTSVVCNCIKVAYNGIARHEPIFNWYN